MSRHEKRYRSEEIAPVVQQLFQSCLEMVVPKLILISLKFSYSCIKVVPKWFPVCLQVKLSQSSPKFVSKLSGNGLPNSFQRCFKVVLKFFQGTLNVISKISGSCLKFSESCFIIISKLSSSCLKVVILLWLCIVLLLWTGVI